MTGDACVYWHTVIFSQTLFSYADPYGPTQKISQRRKNMTTNKGHVVTDLADCTFPSFSRQTFQGTDMKRVVKTMQHRDAVHSSTQIHNFIGQMKAEFETRPARPDGKRPDIDKLWRRKWIIKTRHQDSRWCDPKSLRFCYLMKWSK